MKKVLSPQGQALFKPVFVHSFIHSFIHSAVYVSFIKSLYHFFIQNTCSNPSVGMAHRGNSKDGPQPMLNEDAR